MILLIDYPILLARPAPVVVVDLLWALDTSISLAKLSGS